MKFLTTREAASLLGYSERSITNWFNEGRFPNSHRVGRECRIAEQDIEAAKRQPWKEGTERDEPA